MRKILVVAILSCLSACAPTVPSEPSTKLTAGLVQKEIRIGMPASDVALALGSPNIVSLDENRDEVWVYDKISTQVEQSSSGGGVWLLIVGAGKQSAFAQKSQKTLTVIVKFNKDKQVKDFTYHASSF